VDVVRAAAGLKVKANEALISEQDNRGGYLVSKEVGSKMIVQILTQGKLESSKVVEAQDFKNLEKKYLGEFY
jgi:hypothetical protein